jgi:hypothetical protein
MLTRLINYYYYHKHNSYRSAWQLISWIVICVIMIANPVLGGYPVLAQVEDTSEEKAQAMLTLLSPEERIGQLFLVTFNGPQVNDDSPIYQMVKMQINKSRQ